MTSFLMILLALLVFSVLTKFYDAGKYAHGGKDVREGVRWSVICVVSAIIDAILVLGIWWGW